MPAVNQIELHPRYQARDVLSFCHSRGIAVFGYGNGVSLTLKQAIEVAASHAGTLSAPQVTIAWTLQTGAGAVVRSSRRSGILQNLLALNLRLNETEISFLA